MRQKAASCLHQRYLCGHYTYACQCLGNRKVGLPYQVEYTKSLIKSSEMSDSCKVHNRPRCLVFVEMSPVSGVLLGQSL